MIPRVIHYCWVGENPIPKKDLKCIESWKRYCPDYKTIRWDESNYDFQKNTYMAEAYRAKLLLFPARIWTRAMRKELPGYASVSDLYKSGQME